MALKLKKIKSSPHWYIRGTVRGQYVNESTGTTNKVVAEQERATLQERLEKRSFTTFGQAAQKYLDNGGSEKFLITINKKTEEWTGVLGQFENAYLSDIDQIKLDEAAKKAFPNVKPQTLNRQFYTPFISVHNYAAHLKLCEKQDWRRPRVRRSDLNKKKWFSHEAAAVFFDAAKWHLRALIVFMIYTGARPTEAIEMEIKDLNLDARWAVLNATKTDSYRGVPLHKAAVWALREYLGGRTEGRVFLTNKGHPYKSRRNEAGLIEYSGGYFRTSWNTTLEDAGMEGYIPYSLRHSLNNWLIMIGVEPATREAIMGHDNQSTNSIYSDVPQSHLIEVIDRLPDFTDFSRLKQKNHDLFTKNPAKDGKSK